MNKKRSDRFYTTINRAAFGLSIMILGWGLASCEEKSTSVDPVENTILSYLESDDNFSMLYAMLEDAGLDGMLAGNTDYTFFAPTNEALSGLDELFPDGLSNEDLASLLRYHILNGRVTIGGNSYNEERATVHGDPLFITVNNGIGTLNAAAVVSRKNESFDNGVVHHMEDIILPDAFESIADNIRKRYEMSDLYEQLDELNLINLLDGDEPVSFIVPPAQIYNDPGSWMEMPLTEEQIAEIWTYNIIPNDISGLAAGTQTAFQSLQGDSVYVTVDGQGAYALNTHEIMDNLSGGIIRSKNGSLYNVSSWLRPDKYLGVLVLMDKRYYVTQVRLALAKAKMTGRLYNSVNNAQEQFTVFIPANGSAGTETLPQDENELANILKYHVLLEKISLEELQHNQTYTTWQGEEITITKNGDTVMINGEAAVTLGNLEGTNGVVHIIDRVLTP
jgi:transforming growth factor-beta-induced protein